MPDFALYDSLNVAPHFDVRRRDAMANLTIAKQMKDDAIAQMQERMKAMASISDALNETTDAEKTFLDPDAERLKAKENEIRRKNIIEPLQSNNNDALMFEMSGGDAFKKKYHRELVGSEEFRNGVENAQNYKLGVAATMKGEILSPVEVEFPGGTKQTVPWHDAVDLYNQKVIKKLPFKSSAPLAEFDPLDFMKFEIPDADMKHKGFVGLKYLADRIQAGNPKLNLTDEQAMEQAKLYQNKDVQGASMFTWGRRLPHSSGLSSFYAKQGEQQQNTLQRYQYLKQGIKTNPALIGQIVMNQPYNGGIITGFKIHPQGVPIKAIGTNKMFTPSSPIALIEYTTKNKHGNFIKEQDEIRLTKENDYGFQLFNKLANINREGTAQFVNPEELNAIYQSDPEYFGGGSTPQQTATKSNAQYTATMPDGSLIYSLDGQSWVDEKGNPVQ